jgi:acyl-[acyl-carrier-protein]-phospholipid O-acyltransferase/long-chain-fatty-acid--[acyl-carrier-protein] ligase
MFEAMAFLGILLGTIAASLIADHYSPWIVSGVMLLLAVLGVFLSRGIHVKESVSEECNGSNHHFKFIKECFFFARRYKGLNAAVCGASTLWLIGGMLQMNLVLHCTGTLGLSNAVSGILLSTAAIGIAVGCFSAGKLINKVHNPLNIVITALAGMTVCLIATAFLPLGITALGIIIFITAFLGGMFQIPCLTKIQRAPIGKNLGNMIAYTNLITFIFILCGTALFSIVSALTDENSYVVFGSIGVICLLTMFSFILQKHKK